MPLILLAHGGAMGDMTDGQLAIEIYKTPTVHPGGDLPPPMSIFDGDDGCGIEGGWHLDNSRPLLSFCYFTSI